MARFCKHSFNENATMCSVCIVEVHVTANNIAALIVAQKMRQWRIYIFGGDKT
jgi:primosomal protein N''